MPSPHKTRPLLVIRVYRPKFGGRKFAFRVGSLVLYGLAVWNPYWLMHHPGAFYIRPRRIELGMEIVFRLWKLHISVRLQRQRFFRPVSRRKLGKNTAKIILDMAAHAFANRTFASTHLYGKMGKAEKLAIFWDAVEETSNWGQTLPQNGGISPLIKGQEKDIVGSGELV